MVKRGSITVFLALILSLVTALVCTGIESVRMAAARTQILNGADIGLYCTGIESVRMAAARTQILNGADIGLYSLFGQFDREMLKDYDLFLLDGSCGDGSLDLASVYDNFSSYMKPVLKQNSQKLSVVQGGSVYDNFSSYMKPVLKQNSQKLSVVQGGFSAYRLITDEGGEPFYNQVVQYMKETLGSQGVSLLLDKMKDRKEKTDKAEQAGHQAESQYMKETLGSQGVSLLLDKMKDRKEKTDKAEQAGHQAESGDIIEDYDTEMEKETLGSQGVSLLLDKMKDRKEKTDKAEQAGHQAESGDIIEDYDTEMEETNKKNEEALLEAEKNQEGGELEDNVTRRIGRQCDGSTGAKSSKSYFYYTKNSENGHFGACDSGK